MYFKVLNWQGYQTFCNNSALVSQLHFIHINMSVTAAFLLNNRSVSGIIHILEKRCLRFMGPKEEDWVLVGRWFDSSFWKLINLKDRERKTVTLYLLYTF